MNDKLDTVISLLDEVLMRLQRIERLVDFDDEDGPDDIQEAFDRIFAKVTDKPKLSIVQSSNNVVDFEKND